jgi:hypothetical protein
MAHLYSASTNAFFHRGLHAGEVIPADAVAITPARHRQLLDGQAEGRRISPDAKGKPQLSPLPKPSAAFLRRLACADIKREARRRILAVASLERQANDSAAMAAFAIVAATAPSAIGEVDQAYFAAKERRARIDAIRAASNAIELVIADWSAAALANFNAADAAYWPEEAAL